MTLRGVGVLLALALVNGNAQSKLTTPGFTLHPALIDCPAECTKRGMEVVPAGDAASSKVLCLYQVPGFPTYYGTWRKGRCTFYDILATLKSQDFPSAYQCVCKSGGAPLAWTAPAACAAPAVDPLSDTYGRKVCRIKKAAPGDVDFQLGTFWNGSCYVSAVPFGPAGGAVTVVKQGTPRAALLGLQLLCKPTANAPGLINYDDVLPGCPFTCAIANKLPIPAGDSGNAGSRFLCTQKTDSTTVDFERIADAIGTSSTGVDYNGCYFQNLGKSLLFRHLYNCGCRHKASLPLTWAASRECVGGTAAAANLPSACRVRKASGGDWQIGFVTRNVCHIGELSFGTNGAQLSNATGFGSAYTAYKVQALCKPGDRRKCSIPGLTTTRGGLLKVAQGLAAAKPQLVDVRTQPQFVAQSWALVRTVCPPAAPAYSSPQALVAWIYYVVAGGSGDVLFGKSWSGGNIADLQARGVSVSKSSYLLGTSVPTSLAYTSLADPGDLVFYGKPSTHVAMYLGGNQVLSFSGVGRPGGVATPAVYPVNLVPGVPLIHEIRAYPDFLL